MAKRVTLADRGLMRSSLLSAIEQHVSYEMFEMEKGLDFLIAAETYIVGSYLVSYSLVTPWFSNELILAENVVLRLGRGGKFSDVTDFLEAEAKRLGCTRIAVGTLLAQNNESLSRLYRSQGYSLSLHQLMKEID